MYTTLIIDFSRVLIFSRKEVKSLNDHHQYLKQHAENYQVFDHFYLNEALLAYLKSLQGRVHIYLYSDGGMHSIPEITPKVASLFERIISAEETGFKKSDPKAYEQLMQVLGLQPKEIVFLDDKAANVDAAAQTGIYALQYKNNEQTLATLHNLFQAH